MLDLEYAENTLELHIFQSIGEQVTSVGKQQTLLSLLLPAKLTVLISCWSGY